MQSHYKYAKRIDNTTISQYGGFVNPIPSGKEPQFSTYTKYFFNHLTKLFQNNFREEEFVFEDYQNVPQNF